MSVGFRASLKEIADARGILPGSLYHHFDSKEAIIIELVGATRPTSTTWPKVALEPERPNHVRHRCRRSL